VISQYSNPTLPLCTLEPLFNHHLFLRPPSSLHFLFSIALVARPRSNASTCTSAFLMKPGNTHSHLVKGSLTHSTKYSFPPFMTRTSSISSTSLITSSGLAFCRFGRVNVSGVGGASMEGRPLITYRGVTRKYVHLAAGVPLHASPRSSSDDHERRHRECYIL
jgi:hypothetical protein